MQKDFWTVHVSQSVHHLLDYQQQIREDVHLLGFYSHVIPQEQKLNNIQPHKQHL